MSLPISFVIKNNQQQLRRQIIDGIIQSGIVLKISIISQNTILTRVARSKDTHQTVLLIILKATQR